MPGAVTGLRSGRNSGVNESLDKHDFRTHYPAVGVAYVRRWHERLKSGRLPLITIYKFSSQENLAGWFASKHSMVYMPLIRIITAH